MSDDGIDRSRATELVRWLIFGKRKPPRAPRPEMTRDQQTSLILSAIIVVAAVALKFYADSENRQAIRTLDYSRCWTEDCKRAISEGIAHAP